MKYPLVVLILLSFARAAPGQPAGTGATPCTAGKAGAFNCRSVDLLAHLPVPDVGGQPGARLNDIWGWTDPVTGREYALVGRTDGTAFVDVSDPVNPVYVGTLPPHGGVNSVWRDVKVYADHAFIVSEARGHGLQVFDLRRLRTVTAPPVTFQDYVHYDAFGNAHNIAVNEETGFAYAVGSNTCGGGLHMIDVRDPASPAFAGCFADPRTGRGGTGYTHDVQCVLYRGPDQEHRGREICIGSNETALSIADVTDRQNPVALSVGRYPDYGYVHQGWLTEDHRYFFQDDELDEGRTVAWTRTLVWDLADLDDPVLLTQYLGPTPSSDHNLYVRGSFVFQANYKSGLRILDISKVQVPREVAFFDTYAADDNRGFEGAWSVYPFFESGVVVVSSIGEGLFVLQPTNLTEVAVEPVDPPAPFALSAAHPNPFADETRFTLRVDRPGAVHLAVYDVLGRTVALLHDGPLAAGDHDFTFEAAGLPAGTYLIRARGAGQPSARLVTRSR